MEKTSKEGRVGMGKGGRKGKKRGRKGGRKREFLWR